MTAEQKPFNQQTPGAKVGILLFCAFVVIVGVALLAILAGWLWQAVLVAWS